MNRNSLLFGISIFLTVTFLLSLKFVIGDKPLELKQLELKQTEINEQFISAKILAEKLDQVYTLFSENLALSVADSLAEDSSLPFLKSLTDIMIKYDIIIKKIKPRQREKVGKYYSSPYEMTVKCSFENLGKFLAEMEKSPRLIVVNELSIKNGIERIKNRVEEEELMKQEIDLNISTLTLIKSKVKIIS
jgi:Tfp pilus assembly protein PilO